MFKPVSLTGPSDLSGRMRFLLTVVALVLVASISGSMAVAAPGARTTISTVSAQNVDWMSTDTAASLDVGVDVMVPTWIPDPFTGMSPSVSASSGYYRLYWMIGGDAPTFLYIEGVAGGSLPAGSPADLNKELSINASVQGWNAIHDIGVPAGSEIPIYDQVWWIANGVLYTVSSNNMTGTDSLSLANSLIALQVPTSPEPVPTDPPYEPPVDEAPPVEEAPAEVPQEPAPDAGAPESSESTSQPDETSEPGVSEPTTVSESSEPGVVAEPAAEGPDAIENTDDEETSSEAGGPWSPDRRDSNTPSDGTSGPPPPVIGSDGTGGLYDTALPRIRFVP